MDDTRVMPSQAGGLSEEQYSFLVGKDDVPARLDRFLADKLRGRGLSREKIKELIREGRVSVGEREVRSPKHGLFFGEVVRVRVPGMVTGLVPEEGEVVLLYRDAVLAVLDKPAGLTVHPAPGLTTGTLAHRLVAHFPELAALEGFRPGIVHRLDKDTSGVMLVALTEACRLALAGMFARHEVYKEYLALVRGVPGTASGTIEAPVGRHPTQKTKMAVTDQGRPAKSSWRTLYADPKGRFALVAVRIFSGRTHQVRVHMQHIGHPLWGDALYGGGSSGRFRAASAALPVAGEVFGDRDGDGAMACQAPSRQMLHAWKLGFIHPLGGSAGNNGGAAEDEDAAKDGRAASGEGAAQGKGSVKSGSVEKGREPEGGGGRQGDVPQPGMLRFVCPPPADFIAAARFLCAETLRVVVTGSPGCGKSALLEVWKSMGVTVFSADAEVRGLYERGGDGQRLLRARFGSRFVPRPDAPVDKIALGAAMRDEPLLRREVEGLIHPLVRHAMESFWKEQEARGALLAAAEVPLYLEARFAGAGAGQRRPLDVPDPESACPDGREHSSGRSSGRSGAGQASDGEAGDSLCREDVPVLVGVFCPFSIRRERLAQKRGWSDETIALMESWQWPEEKKMAACDRVLDNTGTESDLRERAGALVGELLALRRQRELRVLAVLENFWRDKGSCPG